MVDVGADGVLSKNGTITLVDQGMLSVAVINTKDISNKVTIPANYSNNNMKIEFTNGSGSNITRVYPIFNVISPDQGVEVITNINSHNTLGVKNIDKNLYISGPVLSTDIDSGSINLEDGTLILNQRINEIDSLILPEYLVSKEERVIVNTKYATAIVTSTKNLHTEVIFTDKSLLKLEKSVRIHDHCYSSAITSSHES